jgi:colicin import membrane protein
MPRKLKTYTTSAGFFDLAIAAPSMKAALEAWGSNSNLFHQGFAKLSDDSDIVADTMARPGVVLRRPVGTNGRFSEHAKLPSNLLAGNANRKPEKVRTRKDRAASRRIDGKTARQAAFAFEEEQQRRERQTQKEEAARERERKIRDHAIAAARAALEKAEQNHKAKTGNIEKARSALDRKLEAEKARWKKQRERLEEAIRKARSPTPLRLVSNR